VALKATINNLQIRVETGQRHQEVGQRNQEQQLRDIRTQLERAFFTPSRSAHTSRNERVGAMIVDERRAEEAYKGKFQQISSKCTPIFCFSM
jgi:Spy/CpxP family protein refolding chaperone